MISGCVQCGKPKEAIDYFLELEEESGLRPNQVTVVSVLAACADLCALDLGKRVHEYSNRSGFKNNVLVCNTLIDMYAKCGSLEEDDGIVHEFVAGDESHPQAEGIFRKWDELVVEMMLRGYVANTSLVLLDIEEEQKVKFIYRHSEKLAVSFGLLNTPAGTTIRIIKNLRVCEDCHSALKLIAAISGREIVVRDRNRFHCFKDGCCSCGDYW
ncbi:unnamed protein product [Linum tenue]|uniref:DYW domain-containing protein n=1 Tax=Linum tenue TaxID=586396 RepID=A0AAV0GZR6_9ROSI|nr:unnamed protein product [Linum tenue]